MWLLVIVLLAAPAGISRVTVLNSFLTYEDCKPERDRIGFEMAATYPEDNTFRIECTLHEQKPLLQPIRLERETQRPFTLVADSLPIISPLLAPAHLSN
jgi:hypothetical protein